MNASCTVSPASRGRALGVEEQVWHIPYLDRLSAPNVQLIPLRSL